MIPKYTDPDRRRKDIPVYPLPDYFILPPKLIISLESFGTDHKHWHLLSSEITSSMNKARKSYIQILPEACIYYSIVSLEYALKTKYCLFISENEGEDKADSILKGITSFDWIVFTSVNGAKYLFERLYAMGKDARSLSNAKIAAINANTPSKT